MQFAVQPGALLSERVYRGPRRREKKTSLNSGPGGRRDNGSLSRHHHSPTANAAETINRELACLATRAGADKTEGLEGGEQLSVVS